MSSWSDLKIELITPGDQVNTWGDTTNNNFQYAIGEAITGSAVVPFSSADVTLTLTNSNLAQTARNLRLELTGTSGGARQLILGSGCQIEKQYIIKNSLADAVTVKNTTGTGISVPAGKSMILFNDGVNVVETATNYTGTVSLTSQVTGILPVANGGSGTNTITGIIKGSGTSAFSAATAGTDYTTPTGTENLSNKTITASTLNNSVIGGATPAAATFTGITDSGNLTFSGTGARILGDYTNATVTNRSSFQTSTVNGTTGIYCLPNGTSNAASWQATNNSDPTNASKILIATNGSTDVQLVSGRNGSGTYLPLSFYTNGALAAQLDNSANFSVLGTSSDVAGNLRSSPINDKTANYTLLATDNGKTISITTGGIVVPASVLSVGMMVGIFNNSASSQTITTGAVTCYLAGTATTGTRTLAQRGLATLLCVASNVFVISGTGLS
jgi:hypothetical protein